MAKAPPPGERRRKKERLEGVRRVYITCDGKEYPLTFPLPTGEQRALRIETGLSIESFLRSPNGRAALGLDSLSVLLWLARRQNGETTLDLSEVDALLDEITASGPDAVAKRLSFEWDDDVELDETDPES